MPVPHDLQVDAFVALGDGEYQRGIRRENRRPGFHLRWPTQLRVVELNEAHYNKASNVDVSPRSRALLLFE
jgi:hypothetical protein